jgi:VanZ family protein
MAPLWLGLEFAQGFVPNRQADGLDMVANLIGVIIGIGLGPLLRTFANRILSSPTTGAD